MELSVEALHMTHVNISVHHIIITIRSHILHTCTCTQTNNITFKQEHTRKHLDTPIPSPHHMPMCYDIITKWLKENEHRVQQVDIMVPLFKF